MIGYILVGTNDLERASAFYDRVLATLGAKREFTEEREVGWRVGKGPVFAICKPFDGDRATFGNGTMIALVASSNETVDQTYANAIEAGGTDEGRPGQRGATFYGAYFRDLDGNKICIFRMS